jgi:hypothetical protein
MIINSNSLTFIDTTDTKKIDVQISSNHPTVQIFDTNLGTYTPNWDASNLVLSATVHADSINVTDLKETTYQWFKDKDYTLPISNSKNLTISTNILNDNSSIVEFTCKATYNKKEYDSTIVFTLVTTGKNGVDGKPGKDGVDGQPGKSVGIKGVAYTNETFVAGAQVTLYSDPEYKNKITTGGDVDTVDGYLVDGYLCVYTGEHFIWTGKIQGPQGQNGESTYLFTRYADDQNGGGFSDSPIGKKYIGFYRHSEKTLPSTVGTGYSDWSWVKYVGEDAKSISLSATTQVFRVGKDGKISPSTLTITPQAVNTSITEWLYGRNGGTFSTTLPAGVVRGNDGKITITGTSMTDNSISVRVGDGTYSDTLTIYKAYDGDKGEDASIVFLTNENITFAADSNGQVEGITVYCDVVAYTGTTPVVPTISEIFSGDIPDGMSLGERTTTSEQAVRIPIVIADNATLGSTQNTHGEIVIPIITPIRTDLRLTWSKVNSGAKGETGVGIKSTTVMYGVSDSASTNPDDITWQTAIPVVADGKYLWTRTVIDYTDGTDTVTFTYAKQGVKGDTGSSGSSVTVSKIEYQAGTSATIAPTGNWSNNVVSVAEGNYLWTKTTFSDNKVAYGVAKQGQKGDKGDKGDQGVQGPKGNDGQQYYTWVKYADTPTSGMSNDPDGKTYIGLAYNKTTATESTTYSDYSWSLIRGAAGAIGPKGADGQQYYTWIKYADNASGANMSDLPNGKLYIGLAYNKTTSTESNVASDYTWALFKGDKGDKGDTGRGISKITEYYLATASSSGVTATTSGWTTTIQSIDVTKKYLWNYEVVTYTDGATSSTTPVIIGVFGNTGATGKGISSVAERYLATASSSGVTTSTTGWTPEIQTLTAIKKYLWNYEIITYTDGTTSTINPVIIGVYGDKGDKGLDGITFQVYSVTGYIISNETPTLTLQTFAYDGSTEITSGATYQWSQYMDDVWTDISGATTKTLAVTKGDVLKAKSYKCTMTYKSKQYVATVTVQDKTDIYDSIMCISSNATNNECYWVLYTLVYSDTEEVDPLLGPISINAPTSPVKGDYWYAVDSTNATATLKKYNGTSWENSTDKQSLSYYWDMINDGSAQIPLGDSAKVKVISCHDFTSTATVVCEVSNLEDGLLTQSSLSLTDASDPIVSDTEPTATVNGQIWIKPNDNGTYLMFVWDESVSGWISSDMDTRSKVYTSRPSSYNAGDLWITASDTDHGSYLQGTLLQAQAYNITYNAADWSPTLRYDKDLDNMKETLNNLSQYVTITSSGLRIAARDSSGNLSPFTSLFTSTALTFYQGSDKLLTLANNQLTAPKIVVENELEVQGEIRLGDLKLIIESNGSFSFAIEK